MAMDSDQWCGVCGVNQGYYYWRVVQDAKLMCLDGQDTHQWETTEPESVEQPVDVITGHTIDPFWTNFRKYPGQQLTHMATGALAFGGAIAGWHFIGEPMVVSLGLTAVVFGRQWGEFQRRRDNIAHDMAWHIVGIVGAVLGSAVAILLTR